MDCAVQLHLAALHSQPGYESFVPGLGVLCDTDTLIVGAGEYKNSVNRQSAYAFGGLPVYKARNMSVDAILGYATGYIPNLTPIIGVSVSYAFKGYAIHALVTPAFDSVPAVVQFSVSFKGF